MIGGAKSARFVAALERIDTINAQDPNKCLIAGQEQPGELVYGQRMSAVLERFAPAASEALQLAVRAQHIKRWAIPRRDYAMDRIGYLRWRTDLKNFHAGLMGELLAESNYDPDMVARVQSLIRKERLKQNLEAQTLEDVACLVFLEYYFTDFSVKHERAKIVDIVVKTWRKMSEQGHVAALQLDLPVRAQSLIKEALG